MTLPITLTNHPQPEVLNAFIDNQLSASDAHSVQQHLESCHACTLLVVSLTQLKAATARAASRFAAPPDAIARLTAQLRSQTRPTAAVIPFRPATPKLKTSYAIWSSIAAVLLFAALFTVGHQARQSNTLTAELLDQHLATLSAAAAPQIVSTDRHTVKPWFQGRIPFSFNLPEPGTLPPDTTLQGADLVYIEGQPTALLLFTIHKHQASVFVTQRSNTFAVAPRSTRSGFILHSTTTPDLRLTAVSDVNPAELDALVASLEKVQ